MAQSFISVARRKLHMRQSAGPFFLTKMTGILIVRFTLRLKYMYTMPDRSAHNDRLASHPSPPNPPQLRESALLGLLLGHGGAVTISTGSHSRQFCSYHGDLESHE
jgi:hypothetical protein